jgi:hypothetical protein
MGKKAVIGVVRGFHAEHALAPVERVAKPPRQAVLRDAVSHTHLLQYFHRTAREHDGAAAFRHLALALQQHAAHAVARQFQRGKQANGASSGNHHRRGVGLGFRVGRRQPGIEHLVVVIDGLPRLGMGLVHGVSPVCAWGCASWGRTNGGLASHGLSKPAV